MKTLVLNSLLVSAVTLLGLLAAEGAIRLAPSLQVYAGEGVIVHCDSVKREHQLHKTFGWTEIPNAVYFEQKSPLDPWIFVQINNYGFRDNFDDGKTNVIILGDSITRGTLANESETFGFLLDLWHPVISFRTYGVGGYSQANTIRVYQEFGPRIEHRLVIQLVYLGNDLVENAERARLEGGTVRISVEKEKDSRGPVGRVIRSLHNSVMKHSVLYRQVFAIAVWPQLSKRKAIRLLNDGMVITHRLLEMLADEAKAQGAELLLVIVPSWNELSGHDDGLAPEQQRRMIMELGQSRPGVYILDFKRSLLGVDVQKVFGRIDRHLSAYGHFALAVEIEKWLVEIWPHGPGKVPEARRYERPKEVRPDCGRVPEYLTAITVPRGNRS